jgi:hypothetical protein
MFLTLVVVPVVYAIMDSLQKRFQKGEPTNYASEMVADYVPNADYIDESQVKH